MQNYVKQGKEASRYKNIEFRLFAISKFIRDFLMRILIVDDDFTAGKLLTRHLEAVGDCEIVPSGVAAVDLFKRSFCENYPIDLICLDIMMPRMNGHETLQQIRKIENDEQVEFGDGVKVLMVSALSDDDTVLQSFMELCDGYVTKPVDRDGLYEKLQEIELLNDPGEVR